MNQNIRDRRAVSGRFHIHGRKIENGNSHLRQGMSRRHQAKDHDDQKR
jgi:hypothetical protein